MIPVTTQIPSTKSHRGNHRCASKPFKILLVEDFDDTRLMMRKLLELNEFSVIEAVDGVQAVELTYQERPDLILMDINLPQMDGLTATRQIRTGEVLTDIPIICVSAHSSSEYREMAIEAGCNQLMTKPIDFDALVVLMSDILNRHSE
ncbi:MAG: response regulator [Pyrinomonadaceae bacterium]